MKGLMLNSGLGLCTPNTLARARTHTHTFTHTHMHTLRSVHTEYFRARAHTHKHIHTHAQTHSERRNPPPGVSILSDWGEEEEI